MSDDGGWPILAGKRFEAPSTFTPESLLREARRQKGLAIQPVPPVCLLDPDGDVVRQLRAAGRARRHEGWACYHTELHLFEQDGRDFGVVGCAVGASFAVLVAEQLFASGCRLLVSITSAGLIAGGLIAEGLQPPFFILIDRALRDEGTSYHYLPPTRYSAAPAAVLRGLDGAFASIGAQVVVGATWTTDAPFRETAAAIAEARREGILAVEMEAAALYALAAARDRQVVAFAHVTNQMGQVEGDFEKGDADGATASLAVLVRTAKWLGA